MDSGKLLKNKILKIEEKEKKYMMNLILIWML